MKLTELLRYEMCGAGYIEALRCSVGVRPWVFEQERQELAVVIVSMDENNEIVRPYFFRVLKTLASNQEVKFPEGEAIRSVRLCLLDNTTDTGRKGATCSPHRANIRVEMIHSVVDRILSFHYQA